MFGKDIVNIIVKYYDYFSFLEKYKNKMNWNNLSRNTNIPYTFFEKYLEDPRYEDKINWDNISTFMKFSNKIKKYFN